MEYLIAVYTGISIYLFIFIVFQIYSKNNDNVKLRINSISNFSVEAWLGFEQAINNVIKIWRAH